MSVMTCRSTAYAKACLTSALLNGGRCVLNAIKLTVGLAVSSTGSQGIELPSVSIGKTSFPGNGVGDGIGVSVGGIGVDVNVAVGGIGDDVIVGAGEAVGTMAGSAVQLASMTISKNNIIWCFMMSPHC